MLVLCGGMSSTFSVSFLLCCFVSVLLSLSSTILRNNIFACPRVCCAKKCFGHGSSHFTTNRHLAAAAAAASAAAAAAAASAAAAAAAAAAATAAASVVVAVFYCCCGLPLQSPYIRKLAWSAAAAAAAAACAVLDIFFMLCVHSRPIDRCGGGGLPRLPPFCLVLCSRRSVKRTTGCSCCCFRCCIRAVKIRGHRAYTVGRQPLLANK